MQIGHVRSIHRFPVKSMCGEELERSEVGTDGLVGDRAFALRDESAGEIRGGKRLPRLMLCSAHYAQEPVGTTVPRATIAFPDGSTTSTDDPEASPRLSEWLGREVTLCPRAPASDARHYRRVQPGGAVVGVLARSPALRKLLARLATLERGATVELD